MMTFHLFLPIRQFAPSARKWGWSGPTVFYALRKWLIWIFSGTVNNSSLKIYSVKGQQRKWRHQLLPFGIKSHQRVHFVSCSGSRFLDIGSADSESVYIFEKVIEWLHFIVCNISDIFARWVRKWGSSSPTVVYALRKWLILSFSESINVSSYNILQGIAPVVRTFSPEMTSPSTSGRHQIA